MLISSIEGWIYIVHIWLIKKTTYILLYQKSLHWVNNKKWETRWSSATILHCGKNVLAHHIINYCSISLWHSLCYEDHPLLSIIFLEKNKYYNKCSFQKITSNGSYVYSLTSFFYHKACVLSSLFIHSVIFSLISFDGWRLCRQTLSGYFSYSVLMFLTACALIRSTA